MSSWMIMIGLQILVFVATGIWVVIWVRQPKDRYDELLDEMNKRAIEKAKQQAAERSAG